MALRARYWAMHMGLALGIMPVLIAWHRWLAPEGEPPSLDAIALMQSRLYELLRRDLANAAGGKYPESTLFATPWLRYATVLPGALPELIRVRRRRARGAHQELPAVPELGEYPDYYRRNFHWQSDGWLSRRSARLYDPGVEFLFAGAADAMRRMALVPLAGGICNRRPRILDVGCGTGRVLSLLREALPKAELFGVDLSPYYVGHARAALRDRAHVVCANAEALPFAAGSFDAATVVFLLHELPKSVRRRVLREVHRVLTTGGRVVLCDSDQPAPESPLRPFFDRFQAVYHEPYFLSYLRDDLTALLRECGFRPQEAQSWFVARVVSAIKE